MENYLEILNPFPKDEKLVYGKVIGFEEFEKGEEINEAIVEITLINDEMIKFDKDIYGNNGLLDSIIKYLIEPIDSYENNIKILIEEYMLEDELNWIFNIDRPISSKNRHKLTEVLKRIFDKFTPYFYEFSAFVTDKDAIKILSKYFDDGAYYKFKLNIIRGDSNNLRQNLTFIIGDILFSASPIVIEKSQLVIVDSSVDPEYRVEDIINYSDFETRGNVLDNLNPTEVRKFKNSLDECLPNFINTIKFTMYNVGQGLCSYVSFNRNKGIFFDIGFSRDACKDKSIQLDADGNYYKYKNKTPKAIFLSHWDTDHILGVVYCNKEIYNRKWIAPNINEISNKRISNSALRLSKYISLREQMLNTTLTIGHPNYKKTMFLINERYNNRQVFSRTDGKFVLHKGKGTGTKGYSNKENNIGLVLELKNTQNLLLTGDVDYIKMPNSILTYDFDFLQVPHHGANVGKPKFKPTIPGSSFAIVPVSMINRHKHPKYKEHLDILRGYGFRIHRTDFNGDFTVGF